MDDGAFSAALAALGTLLAAGARATRRPVLPADVRTAIPWDIGPILESSGRIDGTRLGRFDSALLSSSWRAAAVIEPVLLPGGATLISPPGSVEIRTHALDLSSLAWLSGMLAPASTQRGSYVAAVRIGSGPAFRYPIRLGTLADPRSRDLRATLESHFVATANWLEDVVELVEATGPASPVDLLLLPGSVDESIAGVSSVPHGVEAGAVLVLGGMGSFGRRSVDELVTGFTGPADPWAIAIADVQEGGRIRWMDTLLEHLSHDETLDVAMRIATDIWASTGSALVVADPGSLAAMRVRAVAARLVDQLPRLTRGRVVLPTVGAVLLNTVSVAPIGVVRGAVTVAPIGVGRGAVLEALQQPERYLHETGGARTVSLISRAIETPSAFREMYRTAIVLDDVVETVQGDLSGLRITDLGRPAELARRPAHAGPPSAPSVPKPRYIQATISRPGPDGRPIEVSRTLRPMTRHTLTVWIGPPVGRARHGTAPIDLTDVVADGQRHTLRVILVLDGGVPPAVKTISVPVVGPSTQCDFDLDAPDGGRLHGRIIVQFRNRVLQTAILDAPVGRRGAHAAAKWSIETETVVRASLEHLSERLPFDLAIVHNHGANGDPAATTLHDDFVQTFTATNLDANVANIQTWLSAAAEDPEPYDGLDKPMSVELLEKLALQGFTLRKLVVSDDDPFHLGDPDATPRVQVVAADPNAIFPIEFFYDFPPPIENATLCPNAVTALKTGRCDPKNHGRQRFDGSIPVVCPAGFWSMNRVIERHASDTALTPDLQGKDFGVVNPEQPIPRSTLARPTAAVFAWSDIVDKADADSVTAALRAALVDGAFAVRGWPSWVSRIAHRRPSLLVLLAHTDVDKAGLTVLQIAKNANQSSGRFGSMFVRSDRAQGAPREPGPIVLLLGCDTARAWNEYQSFVVLFKHHGAEIVVGTIATVAAKHAANVACRLVGQLAAGKPPRGGAPAPSLPFGDLLLQARQSLLAEGEVMSLALTSYGDSDLTVG